MNKFLQYLSLLLFAGLSGIVYAQSNGSLRGFISDSTSGEIISFANIAIKNTNLGTSSNSKGFYYLASVPPGEYQVIYSCLGYKSKMIHVNITKNKITEVNIELQPGYIQLDELSIIGKKINRQNETDLGLQTISGREIEFQPSAGEADIFKVLQTSPGVSSTGDITSKYYVRGGNGDQNEVLLNGVTVYNPFHALGIFSVVDPEMISSMEFFKGGFEPLYGGRLSSILNIVTKDGNKNNFSATGQASMIAAKVAVEGPVPNGSFLITGRKSYYTDIYKKYISSNNTPFDFYDLSLKLSYENPSLDKGSKFVVHGFYCSDKVNNPDPYKENYFVKNAIAGLNWRKVWSSPLFSNFNLSYSRFDAGVLPKYSKAVPRNNILNDINADFNFTYVYDSKDELSFGLQNKFLSSDLSMENLTGKKTNFSSSGWDLNFYFNYKFFRWDRFGLDLGIRGKMLGLSHKRPFIFEPRFSFTYLPDPLFALKISFGRYSQEVVTLSDENEIISIFEPWIIIPDYLAAPEATDFILGIKSYFTDEFSIENEAYYNSVINLLDVNNNKYNSSFNDYKNVDGESYGFESLVKYETAAFFVKCAYSLSWTYKLDKGKKYFPRYDKRNSLNFLVSYVPDNSWIFSITWAFSTGIPFTPMAGFYDVLKNNSDPVWYFGSIFDPTLYWDQKYSSRLPFYHRLDLSVSKKIRSSFSELAIGFNIINLYNRKNIFYYDMKTGERVNMLPFMPTAFLKVKI